MGRGAPLSPLSKNILQKMHSRLPACILLWGRRERSWLWTVWERTGPSFPSPLGRNQLSHHLYPTRRQVQSFLWLTLGMEVFLGSIHMVLGRGN